MRPTVQRNRGTTRVLNRKYLLVQTANFWFACMLCSPLQVEETSTGPQPPHDLGPDRGWDRPGNDYHCFSVSQNFSVADCAEACTRDVSCAAWTTIGVSSLGPRLGANGSPLSPECAGGKPLIAPYCTLKRPVPGTLVQNPRASTGLPSRSAGWLKNHSASGSVRGARLCPGWPHYEQAAALVKDRANATPFRSTAVWSAGNALKRSVPN